MQEKNRKGNQETERGTEKESRISHLVMFQVFNIHNELTDVVPTRQHCVEHVGPQIQHAAKNMFILSKAFMVEVHLL